MDISVFKVGNLFGSRRSTIITLYNGAFDSSSALFLVIKAKIHPRAHSHVTCHFPAWWRNGGLLLQLLHEAGFSLRSCFIFLSACSVIHLLRTFFLLPRRHIPYTLPDGYTYGYIQGIPVCLKWVNFEGFLKALRGASGLWRPPEHVSAPLRGEKNIRIKMYINTQRMI